MPLSITTEQSEAIISAAKAKAVEIGIAVCIAVMDVGARLKGFMRMDGAWLGSIDVAVKKAKTSVLFGIETEKVWEFCKPDGDAHGIELTNNGLIVFAGGIPLKGRDGKLIGSIGISGGQVTQDLDVARAGVQAFTRLRSLD